MFKNLSRNRVPLILLVLLFGSAVSLVLSRGETSSGGAIGATGLGANAVAMNGADRGVGGIGGLWDRYIALVQVNETNRGLRRENERLREENHRLIGVMQENARLRAMVGFEERHEGLSLIPGRIIGREMTSLFRVNSVRIESEDARVVAGTPVVSSAGLVGHVSNVSAGVASVVLTADPRSSVDVLVQRNRARGLVRGLGAAGHYRSEVQYLQSRDEIQPGDVLVTSGMGGRYPRDLVVGRVASIETKQFGLFQEVLVEPAVDFARLEEVFFVLNLEE